MAFIGVRSVSGPPLYDGDTLEKRECRVCAGAGKDCAACAGTGKLQVIVPGAKHPVNIKGCLVDAATFKSPAEAEASAKAEVAGPTKPLQPLKGAVHESKLSFQGPTHIEIEGQANGRFRCAIEPGDYTLTVTAKDFKDYQQTLHLDPLKSPIWLEKGHPKDEETTYLPIVLNRP
jgi:hypothetical protein